MSIKKTLKTAAICGGIYLLMDLSYQIGKGRILGILKEDDVTVDEVMDLIEEGCADDKSIVRMFRFTVIREIAKLHG